MLRPRAAHTATLLPSGKVLVAGGTGDIFGGGLRSSEVYNPDTGRWIKAGNMRTVRTDEYWCCRHAVRLASGKVLLAGGFSGAQGRGTELFNPATRTWKATGRLRLAHEDGFLVRLRGSRVLLVGGEDDFGPLKYAELYHPATGRWSRVNDLRHDRSGAAAVLLTNGKCSSPAVAPEPVRGGRQNCSHRDRNSPSQSRSCCRSGTR